MATFITFQAHLEPLDHQDNVERAVPLGQLDHLAPTDNLDPQDQ